MKGPGKRESDEIIGHNDGKSPEVGEWTQNPAGLPLRVSEPTPSDSKGFQPPAPMISTDSFFVRRDL